eukprot:4025314-Ditylum_brightwellii.AAC.1
MDKTATEIKRLIILGVTAIVTECTNLSAYTNAKETSILLNQGSKDELVEMMKDNNDELYDNFSDDTAIFKTIKGGNHSGFSSYNKDDDVAKVGLVGQDEQQKQ